MRRAQGKVANDDLGGPAVDPEVALYYRRKMAPRTLPGLWDKAVKRVYAAGAKMSLAVVAVVFSGMLAFAIVVVRKEDYPLPTAAPGI